MYIDFDPTKNAMLVKQLHRYGRYPGFEYAVTTSNWSFSEDPPPLPDGDGWSLNTFIDNPEDVEQVKPGVKEQICDLGGGYTTTAFWFRKIEESTEAQVHKAAVAIELHPGYEYSELETSIECTPREGGFDIRSTDHLEFHCENGWFFNVDHFVPLQFRAGRLHIKVYRPIRPT